MSAEDRGLYRQLEIEDLGRNITPHRPEGRV